ncbi:MAG: Gfo/Idh/MocA family oxidoreductase [Candidatus Ratteibacteria bacterium]|jgi:predicted dehydrogenase
MKKYVLAGASGRALYMYAKPIKEMFADCAKVVGIFDVNPLRSKKVKEIAGLDCEIFTDFDVMLKKTRPDVSIITTVDRFHHLYIIKSLEAGLDAIVEKPMTIDAKKCNEVLEAEKKTGRKIMVTFNYRYTPYVTRVKELIRQGIIGEILNVDLEWMLDTSHGADYFRRWHRKMENSGGLLVHKATHHFDLVNWWLEEEPEQVMAFGSLRFYGPTRKNRGERCLTCKHKKTCEFYFDITPEVPGGFPNKQLYLDAEKADKYYRDRCVFADDIDIYDTMSVNVKYSGGAFLSYSLTAHSPYEGWKASINGSKGRIELAEYHSGMKVAEPALYINLYNRKGEKVEYAVPKATGGHGGGDQRMQEMLFRGGIPDPLNHQAGSYAGTTSILTGIAANKSIKDGKTIRVKDLVPLDKYK